MGMVYLTDKPLRISGRVWVWFIYPSYRCVFQAGYGYGLFIRLTVVYFRQGMGTVYLSVLPLCISGRVRVRFIYPSYRCVFQAGYGYGLFIRLTVVYFRQGTGTVYHCPDSTPNISTVTSH